MAAIIYNRVEQGLQNAGIEFVRDRNKLRAGDWISTFLAETGRTELVLVVLSDKYLHSPYCMRELLYLFQASLGERARLMDKIVPLLVTDVTIDRAVQRAAYVRHWADEQKGLSAAYGAADILSPGEADRAEWLAIIDFHHHVSDMVAWCANVLMPRGAAGVEPACELIWQRARRARR